MVPYPRRPAPYSGPVGPAVATYLADGGSAPSYGYTTFNYYGNQHWEPFGRAGTACGPAACTTLARFQRGADLGEIELERARNNLGPLGTDISGLEAMLWDLRVAYKSEWIHGDTEYIAAIRNRVIAGYPVLILVDWGSQTPLDWSKWGAHYMVVYGATDTQLFVSNYAWVTGGRSDHHGYADADLLALFKGQLLFATGFWAVAYQSYRLLYAERPAAPPSPGPSGTGPF